MPAPDNQTFPTPVEFATWTKGQLTDPRLVAATRLRDQFGRLFAWNPGEYAIFVDTYNANNTPDFGLVNNDFSVVTIKQSFFYSGEVSVVFDAGTADETVVLFSDSFPTVGFGALLDPAHITVPQSNINNAIATQSLFAELRALGIKRRVALKAAQTFIFGESSPYAEQPQERLARIQQQVALSRAAALSSAPPTGAQYRQWLQTLDPATLLLPRVQILEQWVAYVIANFPPLP